MVIPKFATREEKKAWWFDNHNQVEQDALHSRFEKHKQIQADKGFTLPEPSYRMMYLYDKSKPVGCLITKLLVTGPFNKMQFGFSAYNPEDNYDRVAGRGIALSRILHEPMEVVGSKNDSAKELKYAVTEYLAYGFIKSSETISFNTPKPIKTIPHGIRKAAKAWLKYKTTSQANENSVWFNNVN